MADKGERSFRDNRHEGFGLGRMGHGADPFDRGRGHNHYSQTRSDMASRSSCLARGWLEGPWGGWGS